ALSYVAWIFFSLAIVILVHTASFSFHEDMSLREDVYNALNNAVTLLPFTEYLYLPADQISISDVVVPSTMLTSVWTLLFFVSSLFAQLLVPIDYLRRFTAFWFRDVEHHPLTAIAKVAATLIIGGAVVIKAVRWIY